MVKKPVTMKDIAKEAGVSIATVSMILNGKDKRIAESTRVKVMDIVKTTNYIPNTAARSLVTNRTKTIGLIMPDIANPFFPEIARGVEDKAREARYSIIYCNTDDNLVQEDRCIDILIEKRVDGVIFTHSADRQGGSAELSRIRVPIILIDRDYDLPNVKGKVLVDNFKASYEGVTFLINQGYKKIAYIAGPMNTNTGKDRLLGYERALVDGDIEYNNAYVKTGEYKRQWGTDATNNLIEEGLPFDAIFCGNDMIAIGAMKALKASNIKVPDDVGVMGFDDIYMASMVEPELTTVKQPNYEMGYRATQLLIQAIETDQEESGVQENIILNTELVIRDSTRKEGNHDHNCR